jgi:hypothetical protein
LPKNTWSKFNGLRWDLGNDVKRGLVIEKWDSGDQAGHGTRRFERGICGVYGCGLIDLLDLTKEVVL